MSTYIGANVRSTGGHSVAIGASGDIEHIVILGEMPYDAYIPVERSRGAAQVRSAQLLVAITDCRDAFASIWDPVQYIVFPMLEPRPILAGKYTIDEFAGKLYGNENDHYMYPYGYSILGGRLVNSCMTGSAVLLDRLPDVMNMSLWECMRIDRDMFLVRKK